MKTKVVITVSRLLCFVLLFRVCFLSVSPITASIVSIHHTTSIISKSIFIQQAEQNSLKKCSKELTNNINSILHYLKNRIAENKKLTLSFLFFLANSLFVFASI